MRNYVKSIVVALAFVLGLASAGRAYVMDEDGYGHPLHWDGMPVGYYLVTGNVPACSSGNTGAVHWSATPAAPGT